ncbi:ATP-dependent RNA helicase, putative [Eimeria tenella]|uniref:ATP-dependent RNA helicase, putative n=1 Tax=Eimeria tenella TaxID=5802 RepID=U6KS41_EIMTE|nr:ATP-dependent RNA helicase, putative [Eimeria tenella]CDJ40791.1 ATP-dependent RNA helicase, putative [Eimeria tenella]|eukprot:XP_013231541.1 ATP-dependent RNA helicase, putative [Eimeria tenella]
MLLKLLRCSREWTQLSKRNLLLQQLQQLVVEEADALCDSFYAKELHFILSLVKQQRGFSSSSSSSSSSSKKGVQLVFVGAANSGALVSFLRSFRPDGSETEFLLRGTDSSSSSSSSDSSSSSSSSSSSLYEELTLVSSGGLHLLPARCQQQFVAIDSTGGLLQLLEAVGPPSQQEKQQQQQQQQCQTVVFCNTLSACRPSAARSRAVVH